MKTKTKKTASYFYDLSCNEIIPNPSFPTDYDRAVLCRGDIGPDGICKNCGHQARKWENVTEEGIVFYRVSTPHGSADFRCDAEDDEQYDKKLISAIRRTGGRCNAWRTDGCKNPDGYDGTYGIRTENGLSCFGRFSVEKI